jgi:hypothetical protein
LSEHIAGVGKMVGDDRILCRDCLAYRAGRCTSDTGVWAGHQIAVEWRDFPLRCLGFLPMPQDQDRRTGAERWPQAVKPLRKRGEK